MAVGANIDTTRPDRAWQRCLKALGFNPAKGIAQQGKVFSKAGVPATNTAADAPQAAGDICYDSTNNDVYVCTAYTSGTVFTWTKIST